MYLACGYPLLRFFHHIFCNFRLNIEDFTDTSDIANRDACETDETEASASGKRPGISSDSVSFIVRVVTQHPVLSGTPERTLTQHGDVHDGFRRYLDAS